MTDKLSQNRIFIKEYTPYDFTKHMGQLAVEIMYTDGSTQMLTTKSNKPDMNPSYDFENESDYYYFLEFLKNKD